MKSNSISNADDSECYSNCGDLGKYIKYPVKEIPLLKEVEKKYHVRIPRYYLSLIQNMNDPGDPVRKQCVPSIEELRDEDCDNIDPLGEGETSPVSCLVHRYPDRVLLLVTGVCFMYCRHCTRKRLWHSKHAEPTEKDFDKSFEYIRKNKNIREIIISGGDPLVLPTEKLDYIISRASKIKTIEALRIGTRAPVVNPSRIDDSLCAMLEKYRNIWINVQFNHPNEITKESIEACRKLQKCGIPLNNQAVLLKGINDNLKTMRELCRKLHSNRIRPYYLFLCDPVVGASHFRTSIYKGIEIIEGLRGHIGGMCVPTFVVDGIEGKGKIPISPNYLVSMTDNEVILRNYEFETIRYPNPGPSSK